MSHILFMENSCPPSQTTPPLTTWTTPVHIIGLDLDGQLLATQTLRYKKGFLFINPLFSMFPSGYHHIWKPRCDVTTLKRNEFYNVKNQIFNKFSTLSLISREVPVSRTLFQQIWKRSSYRLTFSKNTVSQLCLNFSNYCSYRGN